jgi:hypothetical protein
MQDAHVIALIAHDVLKTGKRKKMKAAMKYAAAFLDDAKKFTEEQRKRGKKTPPVPPVGNEKP